MDKNQIINKDFQTVLSQIQNAKQKAYSSVNTILIELYWEIGVWPIVYERDNHNNTISQSEGSYVSMSANAYNVFAWQQTPSNTVHCNIVTGKQIGRAHV